MFSLCVCVCMRMSLCVCVCMQVLTAHSSHKIVLDLLQWKLDHWSSCDTIDISARN